jgi:formylglycine-generating enzyme required for sulfatase activity
VTTLANNIPLEFVGIAAGEFMMGCSAGDTLCADDEKPAHRVRITRGLMMGKYEITSAQWQAVTVKSPIVLRGGNDHAYGFANWNMAQEFVDGLNAREDGYVRSSSRHFIGSTANTDYSVFASCARQRVNCSC